MTMPQHEPVNMEHLREAMERMKEAALTIQPPSPIVLPPHLYKYLEETGSVHVPAPGYVPTSPVPPVGSRQIQLSPWQQEIVRRHRSGEKLYPRRRGC